MTNNILPYLSTHPSITSSTITSPPPPSPTSITSWERSNNTTLPKDLKKFYRCCDGLHLRWMCSLDERARLVPEMALKRQSQFDAEDEASGVDSVLDGEVIVGGEGGICPLKDVRRVRISKGVNPRRQYNDRKKFGPNYVDKVEEKRIMAGGSAGGLDEIEAWSIEEIFGGGIVCYLRYPGSKSTRRGPMGGLGVGDSEDEYDPVQYDTANEDDGSVWYLDPACDWHPIAPDFSSYFRLFIVHLGIKGWQGAFTDVGLDPGAMGLMRRFAPERLVVDLS